MFFCEAKLAGSYRRPKATEKYCVVFALEDGASLTLEVREDFYDGFYVGQVGTVTMVGDCLYGFTPDE